MIIQAIGFSLGAYSQYAGSNLEILMWVLTGLVGFIIGFIISSLRIHQRGAGRYFAKITIAWFASAGFWFVPVLIACRTLPIHDPLEPVGMLFFWIPCLAFWSTGWFAWLVLGPFVPESESIQFKEN